MSGSGSLPADPVTWLEREYKKKKGRNPHYSRRAFAKLLGLPPGRFSEVMARRRSLTVKMGARIAEKLALPPQDRERLEENIQKSRAKRKKLRKVILLRDKSPEATRYKLIEDDVFRAISDWPHLAILNLVRLTDFQSNCHWIARRLGITSKQARAVLDRLLRLGLLLEKEGTLVRSERSLTSSHDIPSAAIRKWQRQCLQLAQESLDTISIERRDITGTTMAIDLSKLAAAKQMIQNFRRGLAEFLEGGEQTEIYNLNVALFPLSRASEECE